MTLATLILTGFSVGGARAFGQSGRNQMALIDSLSNPRTVSGSEVMRFDKVRIEAGEMNEDSDPSEHVFRWTNEGQSPLVVVSVKTTCGCAAPSFDRSPVQPGESGSLKITYHPKGHPGGFLRKIFVYTNLSADMPTAVLELSGRVLPSVLPTSDYPVAMGGLLLKRSEVFFGLGERRTERIECLNAGDKVLKITVDQKALPAGVLVEPLTIAPGEIADLVLRFDPAAAAKDKDSFISSGKRTPSAPVFLKGLNLSPTNCMITIKFE